MSIYIHYYPKVSTDLLKLIYYNSQMKPHESEGTDHASSQRLKRDLRDRKLQQWEEMEPRGSSTKYCGTVKAGEWAETGEQTPEPAQAAKSTQSEVWPAKWRHLLSTLSFHLHHKNRHEQNREKKNKNVGYFLHKKKSQDSSCIFCKWTKGCRWNRTPQTDRLRTHSLLSERESTALFATISSVAPENRMPDGLGPSSFCTWFTPLCQIPITLHKLLLQATYFTP